MGLKTGCAGLCPSRASKGPHSHKIRTGGHPCLVNQRKFLVHRAQSDMGFARQSSRGITTAKPRNSKRWPRARDQEAEGGRGQGSRGAQLVPAFDGERGGRDQRASQSLLSVSTNIIDIPSSPHHRCFTPPLPPPFSTLFNLDELPFFHPFADHCCSDSSFFFTFLPTLHTFNHDGLTRSLGSSLTCLHLCYQPSPDAATRPAPAHPRRVTEVSPWENKGSPYFKSSALEDTTHP